jgi:hypothetical protein
VVPTTIANDATARERPTSASIASLSANTEETRRRIHEETIISFPCRLRGHEPWGSAAQAGTTVITDSGSIGGFKMTNTGISGGTATILISGLPKTESFMNTVNGATITPVPVTVNGPMTLVVTSTGPETYSLALSPPTYTKSIGAPGAQAQMSFNLTKAVAPTLLPNFFNACGAVTALLANAKPTYDFSKFGLPDATEHFTFTSTTFGGGANSFATLFSKVGATAVGNGSFSQQAVPKPASMVLLGIGMSGFIALRRFFKRPSLA